MYLSRLFLNPQSAAVRQDLGDCQALHRTLMRAFPEEGGVSDARARWGVLHRVDEDPGTGRLSLLAQSLVEPDWSRLPPGYYMGLPVTKSIDRQLAAIQSGLVLAFRLRANPTRKIDTKTGPDGKKRNGQRVELRRDEDRIAWLKEKGRAGGFALLTVDLNPAVPDVRIHIGRSRGSHPRGRLTFGAVTFEGRLQVTDAERFLETLRHGIGSAKAYGFGLLSIARG
ncbi:MAG: type I-E CRISPR-associated protein Cas6/Cse3/CasE [Bacillota bacterium]